jgi:hypothetical protein
MALVPHATRAPDTIWHRLVISLVFPFMLLGGCGREEPFDAYRDKIVQHADSAVNEMVAFHDVMAADSMTPEAVVRRLDAVSRHAGDFRVTVPPPELSRAHEELAAPLDRAGGAAGRMRSMFARCMAEPAPADCGGLGADLSPLVGQMVTGMRDVKVARERLSRMLAERGAALPRLVFLDTAFKR